MRIAPSPVRLSKDGSETRDAGAHLNCLARPPNLEFLRVLQTHFHPQLLRQNLGKQQKQQFPKVFQSSSFLMMKRKFATKTKKKKNQNSSSNLTMQQQQTSEKIRTYQSISRASLSPSLHANNTHVTESHRFGKKKRSLTRSPHNNRLRCCKNKTPRRRLPTRRKNSVPKRTQNQNRQKKKKK
jgi:hypothetical protein